MNEQKMIEVLASVEDEKEHFARGVPGALGFNMSDWFNPKGELTSEGTNICGTTACLAGHAVVVTGRPITRMTEEQIEGEAVEILGLEWMEAAFLFYLDDLDGVYRWVSDRMGVDEQVLRDKVQAERKYADGTRRP